mgnify:CR=1 FL=1
MSHVGIMIFYFNIKVKRRKISQTGVFLGKLSGTMPKHSKIVHTIVWTRDFDAKIMYCIEHSTETNAHILKTSISQSKNKLLDKKSSLKIKRCVDFAA